MLDPEVAVALEPLAAAIADTVPPLVNDVQSRRPVIEDVMAQTAAAQPMPERAAVDLTHVAAPPRRST
jgi:hypothetical protein